MYSPSLQRSSESFGRTMALYAHFVPIIFKKIPSIAPPSSIHTFVCISSNREFPMFLTPKAGWRRPSDRRHQQRKAAEKLGELLDARFDWKRKYVVVIRDRDGREDFRIFTTRRDALW